MNDANPISLLMFFTLAAGLVIGGGAFAYFLRHRYNRRLAAHALVGDGDHHAGAAPDGALPEILGVLVVGLVIMGLLWFGYASR